MCLTAFAPGTMGPSTAVVRKIFFPQTIGEEWPRPSIGVFHLIFFDAFQVVGRFFSSDVPWPEGPRHCGQFEPAAPDEAIGNVVIKVAENTIARRANSFMFSVSFKRLAAKRRKSVASCVSAGDGTS